jgi:nitrate reductase alpha subunit
VDLKTTAGIHNIKPNGNKEILLNFITPHQKWGIHSTYTDNLLMLTLNRGGPVVWLSEDDAKRRHRRQRLGRALQHQRRHRGAGGGQPARQPGHGDDVPRAGKDREHPRAEITGVRGGIHNSVTRIVLKPTHMIGGYAQFSYGFNYYGTIGTNRDEFVVVRKMNKVDWLDTPVGPADHGSAPCRHKEKNA